MFQAVTLIARLDNVTVMRQSVQQCGSQLGIAKDVRPFRKTQIGGDNDAGLFIQLADQMKQ